MDSVGPLQPWSSAPSLVERQEWTLEVSLGCDEDWKLKFSALLRLGRLDRAKSKAVTNHVEDATRPLRGDIRRRPMPAHRPLENASPLAYGGSRRNLTLNSQPVKAVLCHDTNRCMSHGTERGMRCRDRLTGLGLARGSTRVITDVITTSSRRV